MKRTEITIAGDSPGTSHQLTRFDIGPDDPTLPKIFLQAGLHAGEQPGMMVLHHLLAMLEAGEQSGRLRARFVIFPMSNPIGMGQVGLHHHQGRYHLRSGLNFNRGWFDLFAMLAENDGITHLAAALLSGSPEASDSSGSSDDAAHNNAIIRQAVRAALDACQPVTALDHQRLHVAREACDSDVVLDLHCDDASLSHIFIVPQLMPGAQDLSDWVGAAATLTAEDSGGGSFDEVWPGLWIKLARHFPDHAIAPPPLAATLEYRGYCDVDDEMNRQDAQNLMGFFMGRGYVDAAPAVTPPTPSPSPSPSPAPLPLSATEIVVADRPGLLAYHVRLGDIVSVGDVIADLIILDGPTAFVERHPLCAGTDGLILSLRCLKYVGPGDTVAKVVGSTPLASRTGYLLEM